MKHHSKALSSTGKSLLVVEHEGLEVKGDSYESVANSAVQATEFDGVGNYIVEDTTNEDSGIVALINTAGTKTTTKLAGPTVITATKDTASSINVYFENDVINVQNLTGGAIDITVKPYV